jgi:hypothetical protein
MKKLSRNARGNQEIYFTPSKKKNASEKEKKEFFPSLF